ncbi:MAG: transposase [Planctomycetota bacterium]
MRCQFDGYSLHAATRVDADDRERLERLVRYIPRPALAQGRPEVRGDGKVKDKRSLRLPWRDGTRVFVFDLLTFLERLVALVPHPREHQWTYFGVLPPASPLRDAVVQHSPEPRQPADGDDSCARANRRCWAELLERTFAVDVLRCPKCGGRRHRIATITDPIVARKILLHLGLRDEPPELAPARPEPQMRFA